MKFVITLIMLSIFSYCHNHPACLWIRCNDESFNPLQGIKGKDSIIKRIKALKCGLKPEQVDKLAEILLEEPKPITFDDLKTLIISNIWIVDDYVKAMQSLKKHLKSAKEELFQENFLKDDFKKVKKCSTTLTIKQILDEYENTISSTQEIRMLKMDV